MTNTLVYFFYFGNSRAHKILAAAAIAGVELEQRCHTFPVTAAFKKVSPVGGVPVLETPEGALFESYSIMRHVARKATNGTNLLGATDYERSLVDAWLDLCSSEFDPLMVHLSSNATFGKPIPADFLESTEPVFAGVNDWLAERTYLVGETLTIADIGLAFALQPFYRMSEHAALLAEKYPHCLRLYTSVMGIEKIAAVLQSVGAAAGLPTAEEKAAESAKASAIGAAFIKLMTDAAAAAQQ